MKLIPVIDMKGGRVVAAQHGERQSYAPLDSPRSTSSGLQDVADAYLRIHPFDTLYIADLDAIEGSGCNLEQIAVLAERQPALSLWIDAGVRCLDRLPSMALPVIGSESLESTSQLAELLAAFPQAILSLDIRGERLIGPDALARQPELWPERVILMTLARVGSGAGPDLNALARLRRIIPERQVYAAGGVRGPSDLAQLRALGIAGALVATALHHGAISSSTIRALAST